MDMLRTPLSEHVEALNDPGGTLDAELIARGEPNATFRPIRETLNDSIEWMLRSGVMDPKFAPRMVNGLR